MCYWVGCAFFNPRRRRRPLMLLRTCTTRKLSASYRFSFLKMRSGMWRTMNMIGRKMEGT